MLVQDAAIQVIAVLVVLGVGYLVLVRPQLRRAAEHAKFVTALKPGDRILTGGGLVGRIVTCDGSLLTIALAEGVHVVAVRDSVDSWHPTVSSSR